MNKPFFVINNILISRLILPNSIPAQAVRLALEIGILLISDPTLQELLTVIERKKFDKYVSLGERKEFIRKLQIIARKIEITEHFNICRDPKDDKFLELAINRKAQFIITGDEDLLVLNIFRGIEIITPRDFTNQFSS
ncbi:putative toxin-antitoxin system toxin component, PIN family [Geminocystis sp. CENA526]|uniref:putative toxin-antitoxin system toxin component, PIN family n=1 Tax=Geminocystis sp. CENA526 TaxID=1355871 RepID=UPI003D6F3CCA